MEKKKNIFKELSSISIKGKTDKKGKFDYLSCKVIYLPRTENISTTETINNIITIIKHLFKSY